MESENKEEFIALLQSTGREGIDYVIEDLEEWGFFSAPASCNNHYSYEGGLADHSLNVYKVAAKLKESLKVLKPEVESKIPDDSVIIACLLHDVCKTDIYRKAVRKRKNEIGVWESVQVYEIDYSNLPVGHGEKSVILLLRSGLDLTNDEILAIRWHMAAWDLAFQSSEMKSSLNTARNQCPLATLVQAADSVAANILERF